MADIMTPALGESVTEATVARWTKKAGDAVRRDEVLVELETDKVSLEVVAPEDGVLTDWFRKPQKKYGTSYRIVNLIVGLQIITILLSRGDVNVLGEAYAFGVI